MSDFKATIETLNETIDELESSSFVISRKDAFTIGNKPYSFGDLLLTLRCEIECHSPNLSSSERNRLKAIQNLINTNPKWKLEIKGKLKEELSTKTGSQYNPLIKGIQTLLINKYNIKESQVLIIKDNSILESTVELRIVKKGLYIKP